MGERGSQDRGPKGRGVADNPPNRFERLAYEPDPDRSDDESSSPRTTLFRDSTRTIVASNNSPDVGFDVSINPYRGCEHGCSYCYARPTHEYLGFSAGLDFESRIMVKEDAPELLRKDIDLGLALGREWDVPMPVTAAAREVLQSHFGAATLQPDAHAYLQKDFAALLETMALASGMKLVSENKNVPTGLES